MSFENFKESPWFLGLADCTHVFNGVHSCHGLDKEKRLTAQQPAAGAAYQQSSCNSIYLKASSSILCHTRFIKALQLQRRVLRNFQNWAIWEADAIGTYLSKNKQRSWDVIN